MDNLTNLFKSMSFPLYLNVDYIKRKSLKNKYNVCTNWFECLNLHRRKLLNHVTLQPATCNARHLHCTCYIMHVVYELRVLGLPLTLLSKLLLYHTVKSFHLEVHNTNTIYNTLTTTPQRLIFPFEKTYLI